MVEAFIGKKIIGNFGFSLFYSKKGFKRKFSKLESPFLVRVPPKKRGKMPGRHVTQGTHNLNKMTTLPIYPLLPSSV